MWTSVAAGDLFKHKFLMQMDRRGDISVQFPTIIMKPDMFLPRVTHHFCWCDSDKPIMPGSKQAIPQEENGFMLFGNHTMPLDTVVPNMKDPMPCHSCIVVYQRHDMDQANGRMKALTLKLDEPVVLVSLDDCRIIDAGSEKTLVIKSTKRAEDASTTIVDGLNVDVYYEEGTDVTRSTAAEVFDNRYSIGSTFQVQNLTVRGGEWVPTFRTFHVIHPKMFKYLNDDAGLRTEPEEAIDA
jgi:hypothetical protein